jgi:hypothetical protein
VPDDPVSGLGLSEFEDHVRVTLNGTVIADIDLDTVGPKSIHGGELKGLHDKQGHGDRGEFRNVRIKTL